MKTFHVFLYKKYFIKNHVPKTISSSHKINTFRKLYGGGGILFKRSRKVFLQLKCGTLVNIFQ